MALLNNHNLLGIITMLTEKLPESIIEIAEIIGITHALAIVALRGGTRLTIPVRAHKSHWLNEVIGINAFEKLVCHYAREELAIPKCQYAIGLVTKKEIISDRENLTIAGLARKYDYTERGIQNILSKTKRQANV